MKEFFKEGPELYCAFEDYDASVLLELAQEDFNNALWNVIHRVAIGIALGAAVQSSGLLHIIVRFLMSLLKHSSVRMTYFVFVIFMASVASEVIG